MSWILIGTLLFDVLVVGALFWKMPDWSRPELLFGVTVPASVRRGPDGVATIAAYRRRVLVVTALAFAASWSVLLVPPNGVAAVGLFIFVTFAQLGGAIHAFLAARRAVAPLAAAPARRRVAPLDAPAEHLPGGIVGQLGPFVLFGFVIALLAWAWPQIPARFVTHWNAALEPDGWSDKNPASVFGLVVLGIGICATMPPIAWSLIHRSRRVHVGGEAGRTESARRRAIAVLLLWLEYAMVAIFAPLALTPLVQDPGGAKLLLVVVLLAAVVGPIGLLAVWLVRYGSVLSTRSRAAEAAVDGAPIGDRTEDRHWKWGLIYYNPDDPVLWVEKRFGVGYTFNMARPSAWWLLGAIVGLPLVLSAALVVLM